MSSPSSPTSRVPSRRESTDLMGEFIGHPIVVTEAPGVSQLPMDGTVVDESMNMFYIRPRDGVRPRALPKAGLVARLSAGGHEIPLRGDDLRVRPEDRIKRLAPRGRRRRA